MGIPPHNHTNSRFRPIQNMFGNSEKNTKWESYFIFVSRFLLTKKNQFHKGFFKISS